MQRRSYEEILSGLEDALAFYTSLGLRPLAERSRFAEYRRRTARLIQLVRRRSEAERSEILEREGAQRRTEYIMALMESMEFGDVCRDLRHCEPSTLRPKLEHVLSGRLFQSDENPTSSQARNVLFELTLASKLSRTPFLPVLGEHPDLMCTVEGKHLFIECKRPFRISNVEKQIRKARRQLLDSVKNAHPGTGGVVAISVSKALNPGDKLFVYPTEPLGRVRLEEEVETITERTRQVWQRLGDKIVGIFFHIVTAAFDRQADLFVLADQMTIHPIVAEGSLDYLAFSKLGAALEALAR